MALEVIHGCNYEERAFEAILLNLNFYDFVWCNIFEDSQYIYLLFGVAESVINRFLRHNKMTEVT